MSFFEDVPDPESQEMPRYVEPDWRRVPDELVPFSLPLSQLVYASNETALVLHGVSVYPQGFTFQLVATRHPEAEPPEVPMHEVLHGGPGRVAQRLRIGVLHEDGKRAVYPDFGDGSWGGPGRRGAPEASISSRGGGGTPESSSASFFVWPLPQAGDLTLLFQWQAVGLDETRVVLPGDALRAAGGRATEIWPGAKVPRPTSEGDGGLSYG